MALQPLLGLCCQPCPCRTDSNRKNALRLKQRSEVVANVLQELFAREVVGWICRGMSRLSGLLREGWTQETDAQQADVPPGPPIWSRQLEAKMPTCVERLKIVTTS